MNWHRLMFFAGVFGGVPWYYNALKELAKPKTDLLRYSVALAGAAVCTLLVAFAPFP